MWGELAGVVGTEWAISCLSVTGSRWHRAQAANSSLVDPHDALIHHGVRRSQNLSIRYTERLADAGIEQSIGSSVGDSSTPWPSPSSGCTRPR